MARQNLTTYTISSSIGIAVWNSILVGLGYTFGENWNVIVKYYEEYKSVLIPIVILLLIVILLIKFLKKVNG